jgi:hypothetical protein
MEIKKSRVGFLSRKRKPMATGTSMVKERPKIILPK